jgi:hypothetical protein
MLPIDSAGHYILRCGFQRDQFIILIFFSYFKNRQIFYCEWRSFFVLYLSFIELDRMRHSDYVLKCMESLHFKI